MALYETIFILDSLLPPEEIDKIVDRVKELIMSGDGRVIEVDKWGKRRMAFEIEKKQYGYYVAIEFDSGPQVPNALESEYNYNDKVLRYLNYKFDKNLLKAREIQKQKATKKVKSDETVPAKTETEKQNNTETSEHEQKEEKGE